MSCWEMRDVCTGGLLNAHCRHAGILFRWFRNWTVLLIRCSLTPSKIAGGERSYSFSEPRLCSELPDLLLRNRYPDFTITVTKVFIMGFLLKDRKCSSLTFDVLDCSLRTGWQEHLVVDLTELFTGGFKCRSQNTVLPSENSTLLKSILFLPLGHSECCSCISESIVFKPVENDVRELRMSVTSTEANDSCAELPSLAGLFSTIRHVHVKIGFARQCRCVGGSACTLLPRDVWPKAKNSSVIMGEAGSPWQYQLTRFMRNSVARRTQSLCIRCCCCCCVRQSRHAESFLVGWRSGQ